MKIEYLIANKLIAKYYLVYQYMACLLVDTKTIFYIYVLFIKYTIHVEETRKIHKVEQFFLFGARGTGKTPLLKEIFSNIDNWYIDSLDPKLARKYLLSSNTLITELDGRKVQPEWIIIDEIQKVPSMLDLVPYSQKSAILYECLKNNQLLKLQENALRQISNYREKEIGNKVIAMWKDLSPQTRRYASDLLLYIESNHDALLTGLEKGIINIGEMNFDLERRRTLLWWTDNENTKTRAKRLFTDSGVSNRKAAMDKMKPALTLKGNNINGEKIFSNTCATCHKFGSIGNEVGPVLTEISRKSKATVMHDILDPNAAVDPKYVNHSLETKSGAIHMGIVANETDKSVTIQKIGGEKILVNKSEIKSFRSLGTSLMMEGFENALSTQQMADLLEYLQKGIKK